jgi:hypothetical protein
MTRAERFRFFAFVSAQNDKGGRSVLKKRLKSQDFSARLEMTRNGAFEQNDKVKKYVPYSFACARG